MLIVDCRLSTTSQMRPTPSPQYIEQLEAYIQYSEARTKRLEEERELLLDKCRSEFTQHVRYNLLKVHVNRLDITTAEKNAQVRAQVRSQAHPLMRDYDNHCRAREQARKDREEAIFQEAQRGFGNVGVMVAGWAQPDHGAPPPLPSPTPTPAPAPEPQAWSMLEDM